MARTRVGANLGNGLQFSGTGYCQSSLASSATNNYSFFCWVYITQYNTGNSVIIKNGRTGSGNSGYKIYITSTGVLKALYDGTATTVDSGTVLSLNTWYHVGLIRDSGTSQLYINGVAAGSTQAGAPNGPENMTIVGAQYNDSTLQYGEFLYGIVDDVRLYNRVLTAGELTILTNFNQDNLYSSISTNSLRIHLKLDETSGSSASDQSGNSFTGTITNGTFTSGKVYISFSPERSAATTVTYGNALRLQSASSQYVGRAVFSTTMDNITFGLWYKPTDFATTQKLFCNGKSDGQEGYDLNLLGTTGEFRLNLQFTAAISSGFNLTAGSAYLLVGRRTSGTWQLLVNGTALGSTITNNQNNPGDHFTIGASRNAAGVAANFANGTVDEARLYHRALTNQEVADWYTSATNPSVTVGTTSLQLAWKFDDGSGTTVADSSGNSRTGNAVNTPTWVAGYVGTAIAQRSVATGRTAA